MVKAGASCTAENCSMKWSPKRTPRGGERRYSFCSTFTGILDSAVAFVRKRETEPFRGKADELGGSKFNVGDCVLGFIRNRNTLNIKP